MRPVLLEWRGFRLWSYPALLYLGMVAGVVLQYSMAPAMGLEPARVYWATLTLLPIALAGSRVLFVLTHWSFYKREPRRIWRRGETGLAMYGGVPFMLLASLAVLPLFDLPFWRFWDSAVFCIFPGMAMARVGCLLHGCCAGRPSRSQFSLWLPDGRGEWAWRVPLQSVEAAAALMLLALCAAIWPALPHPGALFLTATAGYAVARIATQRLRAQAETIGWLDVQTAISLTLLVLAGLGLTLMSNRVS
jgi:prolipoprotein diacylglyceryltransferase